MKTAAAALLIGILAVTARATDTLCVMSYNLRVPVDRSPYTWAERRRPVGECIRQIAPDLLGTQEGIRSQLEDLAADLPEFAWTGAGRDGEMRGEFSAVFFRRDRIQVREKGNFWLSSTPDVPGSRTWGNKLPRMVTWIRFEDRRTHQECVWFNTHFDHQSQPSREQSARLLADRARAVEPKVPVLITGDFNAAAGQNPAYDLLVHAGAMTDTWTAAPRREGEGVNTFNGFARTPIAGGRRIDWVLCRGDFVVEKAAVVLFQKDGRFASDHCPVAAWLRFGSGVKAE